MSVHLTGILLGLLALGAVAVSACSGLGAEYERDGLCRGPRSPMSNEVANDANITIQWTPDGSQLLFDYSWELLGDELRPADVPDIYAVHVSGNPVRAVLDLPSSMPDEYGYPIESTPFDLSADGYRIAYAACAVSEKTVEGVDGEGKVYNSEIFVSEFDGSNVERLTNNTYLDALPAWSPDGESIAFVSDPGRSIAGIWKATAHTRLTIQEVATGRSRVVGLPEGYAVAPIRLEWSPSGDRIAFVMLEGVRHPWNLAVYIVGADGTGLSRVADAVSGPTWSPDGKEIAMVVPEGNREESLYTFEADGSNPVKVGYDIRANVGGSWGTRIGRGFWMGNLSWSPNGSAILIERFRVEGGRPAVVPLGTGGVQAGVPGGAHPRRRAMMAWAGAGSILASPLNSFPSRFKTSAWSPDGTQIAMREDIAEFVDLYVVDLQGNSTVVLELERIVR